ncbi:ZC3H3 [Bugula neritina]|uniref:ZC3H3 n=1 Tax=Bugula neritina TaxID=10212 RepID=A0A7J7JIV9_BUGNE|nr:ZC3H3 [Bugula neritina]
MWNLIFLITSYHFSKSFTKMPENDNERLMKEIAYYSAAIRNHNQIAAKRPHNSQQTLSQRFRDQTHTYHRPPTSSKYSLVRNTQSKGQSCATSNAKRQVLSHDSLTERKATTSRTVLPPADQQIQQRRVVKPSKSPISSGSKSSHSLSSKSNRFVKTPMVVTANECHYLPKLSNNKATSTESLLTKQRCNKYVWVNKNLLSQNNPKSCTIPTDAVVASTSISNQKSPLLSPKQTVTARNTEKLLQPVGKYKLVKKRLSWSNRSKPTNKARFSPHLSKSGTPTLSSARRTGDKTVVLRKLASHYLQKSATLSIRAKYKKNNTNEKQCLYYMRYGKCKRGDNCYFIHDPERVAVCTRYLRGTCTIENCSFSHEARKEKVPVCQHFLRGCCLRDNCPYLHVNVGKNAPICKSFAVFKYCHLGEKCKKLHTDICPNRDDNGGCPKGARCKLRHPKKPSKQTVQQEYKNRDKGSAVGKESSDSLEILREGTTEALPSYISLSSVTNAEYDMKNSKQPKQLKRKPNFL